VLDGVLLATALVASLALEGDVARGEKLVANRAQSLCVLCHPVPGIAPIQTGTLGPSLAGVGARLSVNQLRERVAAPERANPDTIMPSYGRSSGFTRVAPNRKDQALLDAQQIEDVVAYLATLK
jgi:L-cysteine S-thiosulfotransferase